MGSQEFRGLRVQLGLGVPIKVVNIMILRDQVNLGEPMSLGGQMTLGML